MMIVRRVLVVAICGATVIGMIGCKDKNATGKSKKARHVQAVSAKKERLVEFLETTGSIVATNTVMMQATIEGPIVFCPWREGDRIERLFRQIAEDDSPAETSEQ